MFGQQTNLFGTPTSQPSAFGAFGTTTNTFGASTTGGLFGQTQPAQQQQPAFGGTSAFGSTAFGQPQQPAQQQSNPFATTATTGFGAPANPFGGGQQTTQPAQSSGLFGNAGLFGAPAQQQQQPVQTAFGQPQQQTSTGLFGSTSTGGLFGQPKTGFGTGTTFGAQPTATSNLFGTQSSSQPAGGLFGSSTSSTMATPGGGGLFGQQSTSNLFGGMSQQQQSPSGTTVKFSPVIGTDGVIKNGLQASVQTKNYCICTMKEYNELKSQEELRLEDYQAGRKFGTQTSASSTGGGLFGASSQPTATAGTGLFGATSTGFNATSAFGQNMAAKPTGFGTTSAGLFGQPAQPAATGGFFGQPQPATAAPSAFGGGGLFGSSQPATTSAPSIFGGFGGLGASSSTTNAGSAFGTSTTGFGTTAPAFGGFGQPAATQPSTGLFGQSAAAPATTAFGGFGTGGGLFGAKPAATTAPFGAFGTTAQPAATTGFGAFPSLTTPQPAANTGGLFSAGNKPTFGAATTTFGGFGTSTGFGGFGSTAAAQPSSIFGQPAATSTGLFGTQTQQPSTTSSIFGTTAQQTPQQAASSQASSGGNIHAQVVEMLRHGVSDTEVLSNMYAQLPGKDVERKPAPLSGATINAFITNAKKNYAPAAGSSRKDERTYNYYVAPSHKVDSSTLGGVASWRPAAAKRDEKFKLDRALIEKLESEINKSIRSDTPRPVGRTTQIRSSVYASSTHSEGGARGLRGALSAANGLTPPVNVRRAFDLAQDDSLVTEAGTTRDGERSEDDGSGDERSLASDDEDEENVRGGVRGTRRDVFSLNRPDYYTIPDKSELELDEKGQCVVKDFFVGRYQCGGVRFLGSTNVAGLNLDALISIASSEVAVYPDERRKPPVGRGLNKAAMITFENVRPTYDDDSVLTREQILASGFEEILRARIETQMEDAEFVEYNADTCQLTFMVKHFSRYKLTLTREETVVPRGASINQPISQSVNQPIKPINQSVKQSIAQSISQSINVRGASAGTNLEDAGNRAGNRADDSKGKEDSFKENRSPPMLRGKRPRCDEEDNQVESPSKNSRMTSSVADSFAGVTEYFDRLPLSPPSPEEEFRPRPDYTDQHFPGNGTNDSQDVVNYFERCLPAEESRAVRKRRVVVEYGASVKPVSGAVTFAGEPAAAAGVMAFLATPEGQFLAPFRLAGDVALSEDSRRYLEEMLQMYLLHCEFTTDESGQSQIIPPASTHATAFIKDFCRFTDRLPDLSTPFVHERILWSLFETLYGEADVAELRLCQKLETWLKDTLAALQPAYHSLEDIPATQAMKAIFEAVLGCRNQDAVDIALHFGLYDQAATILALWDEDERQPGLRATVQDAVGDYLDEVMQTVQDGTEESRKYWIKALMILSEVAYLNKCAHMDIFSVCQGLDWLQCLAACALHFPQAGGISGLWDILRKYEDHAAANPHCALPGQASASSSNPPSFLYSMMTHYCRHSRPNMTSSLDCDLLRETAFDVRVRWFVMRLFSLTGDGFQSATQLTVTADFAKALHAVGYPHVAVIALLHLPASGARHHQIRAILMSLVRTAQENPNVYDSIMEFLRNDLHVAAADIESIKATLALRRGDKLTAFTHFYHAGSEEPCVELMRTFILPLMASSTATAFSDILERLAFVRFDSAGRLPKLGAFFELLRVLEEWMKTEETLSEETQAMVEECLDVVADGKLFPSADSAVAAKDTPLDGFVRQKLRHARAVCSTC
ncbi:putative Nuclear pore complex protein Nup98-Nup96 [Hypsibius exemplaris]|uniref:Nuclear pore complex protein Nup98-Nup96 n=1 Tax=Hypsibius exemplaris TaxID=2072580 RepID=A0A1W0WV83_HYPEX|nr:putative Nuclear pore complex protein Nup98-Nup96 [Hypsibius exemplaris]